MPLLVTISREGSVSTETRRVAVTALAGLVALALPGAIASSNLANAALVDLGALVECDAQETGCPEDDLEPREQIGIVATNDRQPGDPKGGLPAAPSKSAIEPCCERRHGSFVHCDRRPTRPPATLLVARFGLR